MCGADVCMFFLCDARLLDEHVLLACQVLVVCRSVIVQGAEARHHFGDCKYMTSPQ